MPLSKILESRVTVSVLEVVGVHLSEKSYCRIYFYANRPIIVPHGINTDSYAIGFCSRLIELKAY